MYICTLQYIFTENNRKTFTYMKVSLKQLKAILNVLHSIIHCDGIGEESKSEKVSEFLSGFKISSDKATELIETAINLDSKTAYAIIEELDENAKQEVSNIVFETIISDGEVSDEEATLMFDIVGGCALPFPNTETWNEFCADDVEGEDDEEETFCNDEDEESFSDEDEDEEYADDEERIEAWLEENNVTDDGFEVDERIENILEHYLEDEIGYTVSNDYGLNIVTIKDLLLYIMDYEEELPYSELLELAETIDEPRMAVYWAHLAVVLYRKALPENEDSYEYSDIMESLSVAYETLGDCFSRISRPGDVLSYPRFSLAAKSYEAAYEADPYKNQTLLIKLGKSHLGLEDYYKAWDIFSKGKYRGWMGQTSFIKRQESQALLMWDTAIEEDFNGWGEYFKGRYLWNKKRYSEAIELWKKGEEKHNAECSGELFNWIVGHPDTPAYMIEEQLEKILKLQGTNKCVSGYKYIYKHLINGNITLEKVNLHFKDSVIEYPLIPAMKFLFKGIKNQCPYCLQELKKEGYNFDARDYENALKGWGYDRLEFSTDVY